MIVDWRGTAYQTNIHPRLFVNVAVVESKGWLCPEVTVEAQIINSFYCSSAVSFSILRLRIVDFSTFNENNQHDAPTGRDKGSVTSL